MERMRTAIKTLGFSASHLYAYLVCKSTQEPCMAKVSGENVQLWKNQAVFSLRQAVNDLNYSKDTLCKLRDKLVDFGLIKVIKKNHYSIITIKDTEKDTDSYTQPTANASSYIHNQNVENDTEKDGLDTEKDTGKDTVSEGKTEKQGHSEGHRKGQSYINQRNDAPNEKSVSVLLDLANNRSNKVKDQSEAIKEGA